MADETQIEAAVQALGRSIDGVLAENLALRAALATLVDRTSNALCAVSEDDKRSETYRSAVAALDAARTLLALARRGCVA